MGLKLEPRIGGHREPRSPVTLKPQLAGDTDRFFASQSISSNRRELLLLSPG